MSEEIKEATEEIKEEQAATEEPEKTKKGKKKKGDDTMPPDEAIHVLSKGKLILYKPFIADDVEIKELVYDFENLDGIAMSKAMDRGAPNGANTFRLTAEQALELFIASAGKETDGVDAQDVRRGLSSVDSVKAIQLATVFFVASSQGGNARITK
jgi:hypothetical protein